MNADILFKKDDYSNLLGGCPFHGRVERDEIPTRESPPKQSGTRWTEYAHCLSTIQVSQWDNGIVAPVADVISMGRCYIQDTYSIQSIVFRKKYRTMERKKRSKGSVWEFCYAKKKFGKFEEEMKA